MPLIIDGYNLLNASGVFAKGRGGHTLERARQALLVFLSESLSDEERRTATIVFDAKDAPPGLPRRENFRGMQVMFAAHHAEADDLIEELIRAHNSPRRLTVVSSDNRLKRAARRRKATPIDSDQWYAELVRQAREREQDSAVDRTKPTLPLEPEEVEAWLEKFAGDLPADDSEVAEESDSTTPRDSIKSGEPAIDPEVDDAYNPFPPGYAEDLLEEDDST